MSRKTIYIKDLIAMVNRRLETKDSTLKLALEDLTPEQAFRLGSALVLEQVLHATDNYAGFKYQFDQFDEPSHILKQDFDGTRRVYYKGNL